MKSEIIKKYFGAGDQLDRMWSWDHCFETFQKPISSDDEILALRLAFYLASWGMYRGSSGLLQKNHHVHLGAIKIIKKDIYNALRCSEENDVDSSDIELILKLKKDLSSHYSQIKYVKGINGQPKNVSATDTLISKVILGCFGCIPAYDNFFLLALKNEGLTNRSFNKKSINELFDFIAHNQTELGEIQKYIKDTYKKHYPIMKLVDIYFWQKGYDLDFNKVNK